MEFNQEAIKTYASRRIYYELKNCVPVYENFSQRKRSWPLNLKLVADSPNWAKLYKLNIQRPTTRFLVEIFYNWNTIISSQ